MKCKALFLTLGLFPLITCAQNLVPNGSFEDYTSCPDHLDGMEFVEHWYKSIIEPGVDYYLNPSPDYFHECALHPSLGVPDNATGNHLAYEGVAYSGLVVYSFTSENYREIMGVELTSPLMPGQTYYCSFRYVRPVGDWSAVGLATDKLGMKFSETEVFTNAEQAVDGFAHLKLEEIAIDSVNWGLLYGEVIPEQAYQYLHIGNFFSDQDTYIQYSNDDPWTQGGYYIIDNIRVSIEPLMVTSVDSLKSSRDFTVFPNPVNDDLHLVSAKNMKNIQIYSISGQLIEDIEVNKEKTFQTNLSHLSKGFYIAIVQFENGDTESIKINKI